MRLQSKFDAYLGKLREEAEEREAKRRAREAGLIYLDLTTAPVQVDSLGLVPEADARTLNAVVFEYSKPNAALAVTDPRDPRIAKLVEDLKARGLHVKLFVGSLRGLRHLLEFYRFLPKPTAPITSRIDLAEGQVREFMKALQGLSLVHAATESFDFKNRSITEFLEIALAGALANRASDIHFEPQEHAVKLRYRVDGRLHDVTVALGHESYRSMVSRVKLLSNLKLNVQDRPQDGRFTIGFAAKEIEMRVAIAPSEYGEIIVMRILDPDAINITLAGLGLRPDDLAIVEKHLTQPNGMILNTGPTGSGKTTTLYAFIRNQLSSEIKIITIEDPIEYHIEGIEQTQTDDEAGYTFANGLRSIMRQDPDIILVGEIRDKDTTEIGLQAALTGHLVFSTIHANEAAGAIPRFLDLGARASSIGPALRLVIGQRLVRKLCTKCRIADELTPELKGRLQLFLKKLPARVDRAPFATPTVFKAAEKGCAECTGFGYRGRTALYELLVVGKELEELILKEATMTEFLDAALGQGMVTMQEDGILKVMQGITSFDEVREATGDLRFS